jgi:hypothetical protein
MTRKLNSLHRENWAMPVSQPRESIDIDSVHCRAICEEIGYRLGRVLSLRDIPELPPQLALLLDRLCRQDQAEAPSIVPSMEDLEWHDEKDKLPFPAGAD